MKVVGLFRELLPRGLDGLPSLRSAVGLLDAQSASLVANYLEQKGVPVRHVMGDVPDPLDARLSVPGGASLLSDGVWIWRQDLRHYVQRYHVGLPLEFVERVVSGQERTMVDAERANEAYAQYLASVRIGSH